VIGAPTDGLSEYVLELAFVQPVAFEKEPARLRSFGHSGTKGSRSTGHYNDGGRAPLQHRQAREPLR
jgi:hypothetical protein